MPIAAVVFALALTVPGPAPEGAPARHAGPLVRVQDRTFTPGYGTTPRGYGEEQNYGRRPEGYGSQPPGYGERPPGYGSAPGYGATPPGYGRGTGDYGKAPPGTGVTPPGYGVPPPGYGNSPGYGKTPQGYGQSPGYGQAPPGYGVSPRYGAAPGYGKVPKAELPPPLPPRTKKPVEKVNVPPATPGVQYRYDAAGRYAGALETIDNVTREYDVEGRVIHTFVREGRKVVVFDAGGKVIQHAGGR
jgi:hypothetical protein